MKSGPVPCSGDPASPFRMDPDRLEEVPADFTGPCLIELTYRHRGGRGRWWQPNRSGYTNVFVYTGVYTAAEARDLCKNADDFYPVDATAALRAAEAEIAAMRERVAPTPDAVAERVAAIRKRLDEATPGPWESSVQDSCFAHEAFVALKGPMWSRARTRSGCGNDTGSVDFIVQEDSELIANAPADLRFLLDLLTAPGWGCAMMWISKGSVERELCNHRTDRPRRRWLLSVLGWMDRNGRDYFNEADAAANAARVGGAP